MKRYTITLFVVIAGIASCTIDKGTTPQQKQNNPSTFLPKAIDDDWSRWIVGEWVGSGESDAGKGKGRVKIELGLNGQYLMIKGEAEITEMSPEQVRYLKNNLHATDEEIRRFQSETFKSLEIYTVDPKTGEVIGYLFDSLRCMAKGTGKREGNKEIMNWVWTGSGKGATSVRITEKLSEDRVRVTEKSTLPDGSIMEDKGEMTRVKKSSF